MEQNQTTPKNIAFISARFHPFKGGAEQNTHTLAKFLANNGYQVTVLTTDASPDSSKLAASESLDGFKIIRSRRWNNQLNLGFYPGMLFQLLKLRPNIVHVENGPGFIWHDIMVFIYKLSSPKAKFIITPHGPFLASSPAGSKLKKMGRGIIKTLMSPYFRLLWSRLWDTVIEVNPNQRTWLMKDYGINPDKIKLVENGIDKQLIAQEKPTIGFPVEITYLGRISWYKGIDKVIEALSILKSENLKVRFSVMGKIFDEEILKLPQKYDLDNVRFINSPSDPERDRILLEESHIHILPSQWEATGIALLEAMAKGNALITTEQNEAARMLIIEGETGFIYNYSDVKGLAEIIKKVVTEHSLRQQMMEANLARARNFTWEEILPKYKDIIEYISNDPNRHK